MGLPREQRSRVSGNLRSRQTGQSETRQPAAKGVRVSTRGERRQHKEHQGENQQDQGKHFVSPLSHGRRFKARQRELQPGGLLNDLGRNFPHDLIFRQASRGLPVEGFQP